MSLTYRRDGVRDAPEHTTTVERILGQAHHTHARLRVAVEQRMLDGRRAPVPWQQRRVHIDGPVAEMSQHSRGQQHPKGHHNPDIKAAPCLSIEVSWEGDRGQPRHTAHHSSHGAPRAGASCTSSPCCLAATSTGSCWLRASRRALSAGTTT